ATQRRSCRPDPRHAAFLLFHDRLVTLVEVVDQVANGLAGQQAGRVLGPKHLAVTPDLDEITEFGKVAFLHFLSFLYGYGDGQDSGQQFTLALGDDLLNVPLVKL